MNHTHGWNLSWIGSLITALATLAGVFLGQRSARRLQREQWLSDHRRAECKELLEALTAAYRQVYRLNGGAAEQDALDQIVHNRLFIAKELKQYDFWNRWLTSKTNIASDEGGVYFKAEYANLSDFIIKLANDPKA
ncbi:MAG: hypothetical protein WAL85_00725 [Candidatus Korobacteraceae bacterium]